MLEAFAAEDEELLSRPGAIEARLQAFGFSDGMRTRAAVRELTRGLTRSSRLMQQILPLLLGWLAESPDPDLGLLNVRNLCSDPRRSAEFIRAFRESPEAARQLCCLVGTTRLAADVLQRNPELVDRLPDASRLATQERADLVESARLALGWRSELEERQRALQRWKDRHLFGVMARDVLHERHRRRGRRGRHGDRRGRAARPRWRRSSRRCRSPSSLSGASVAPSCRTPVTSTWCSSTRGRRRASTRRRCGWPWACAASSPVSTPTERIWNIDLDLRPEGKQGPLARSVDAFATYFHRWAYVWERQAMLRARPVAGDAGVAQRFMDLLEEFVWEPGLSEDDAREIRRTKARVERERMPPGEDPDFHLKLGRGSLSDVEWTVQLAQLRHGVRSPSTMGALDALATEGVLSPGDAEELASAYRLCETIRNRLYLVAADARDALPAQGSTMLLWLARSLDTTPAQLREDYRRATRRARRVVERLFYDR